MKNSSDFDDNDSNPSEASADGSGNFNKKTHNGDNIKALNSANEQLLSVLRLTATGTAHSGLFQFEPNNGQAPGERRVWLALKNKYQNTSRRRRRRLLRRLDNSVMRADIDSDVFLSERYQLRDELSDLGKAVFTERLTAIVLDALTAEKYPTIKIQAIRDPGLSLKEINKYDEDDLHESY